MTQFKNPRGVGYVYLAQSLQHGWVKIGWARDIAARMVGLASSFKVDLTLLGSVRGTQATERAMQRQFAHVRLGSEWFNNSEDLLQFARELPPLIQISLVTSPNMNPSRLRGYVMAHAPRERAT